jgi:hypothetical protein
MGLSNELDSMRVAPIQASGLAGGGIGVVPGSFKDRVLRRFAASPSG